MAVKESSKIAIIIGAGPAGLTAAYELLKNTDIKPVIIELDSQVGGLSKTVNYKNNRIDIGGHRFFSKSDRINNWWKQFLPEQSNNINPDKIDKIFLRRSRLSRIFFLRKFFDYPVSLSIKTLLNLGLWRTIKITLSYLKIKIFPIKHEHNLQDFFINRFGCELYKTFFKHYTEKLWGINCDQIDASWGAQRVKGVSISKAISHALKSVFKLNKDKNKVETSLIDSFLYPKFGPGQMWEAVAEKIINMGGFIYLNHEVINLDINKSNINKIITRDLANNKLLEFNSDYVLSSMPIKDLVNSLKTNIPVNINNISQGLLYRDFITVGLLLSELKIKSIKNKNNLIKDNWIYVQERDVHVGRIQIFNNWSPYMVENINNIWIGLEYFCQEGDFLWNSSEQDIINLAIQELYKMGFIEKEYVIDSTVIKVKKAYPAYFGEYKNFNILKEYLNKFENLYLIGRNGMHRYNNMDHSMLTAIKAVENIQNNIKDKSNIWFVNTEKDYHEERA